MQISHYRWPEIHPEWDKRQGHNAGYTLVLGLQSDIPEHLMLLKKILGAIGLDFEQDIHFLIVTDENTIRLLSEPQLSEYHHILAFGLSPEFLGLPKRKSDMPQVYAFENIRCIIAPGLGMLAKSPEQKKALWSVLKTAFAVA